MRIVIVMALSATLAALAAAGWGQPLSAHPGGLNAQGCHNDRKNGGYHCHRTGRAAAPVGPSSAAQGDVYFASCADARAAGRANIRRGEPGYRPALDRDDDGIACEA